MHCLVCPQCRRHNNTNSRSECPLECTRVDSRDCTQCSIARLTEWEWTVRWGAIRFVFLPNAKPHLIVVKVSATQRHENEFEYTIRLLKIYSMCIRCRLHCTKWSIVVYSFVCCVCDDGILLYYYWFARKCCASVIMRCLSHCQSWDEFAYLHSDCVCILQLNRYSHQSNKSLYCFRYVHHSVRSFHVELITHNAIVLTSR